MRIFPSILGILISFMLLFLLFSGTDVNKVISFISVANPIFILSASSAYMFSFLFRGLRWKIICSKKKIIKLSDSISYSIMGWAGNNILPLRAGEFIRAKVSGKREGMGGSFVFGTIISERIFDFFTLLTFLFASITLGNFPDWVYNMAFSALFFLLFAIVFIAALISRGFHIFERIKFLKRSGLMMTSGFSLIRSKTIPVIYLLSVFSWLMESLVFYFSAAALGIPLDISGAIFITAAVNIAISIPSAPGYVGTFHFFCALALGALGTFSTNAIAFAVLAHASAYIPVTLSGILLFARYGLIFNIKQFFRMPQK